MRGPHVGVSRTPDGVFVRWAGFAARAAVRTGDTVGKRRRCCRGAVCSAALCCSLACATESPPLEVDGTASEGIGAGLSSTGEGANQNADTSEPKLDVAAGMASGEGGDCQSGGGQAENTFSIIWIANTPEGTVSKIDTKSGVELARYFTGPTNGDDDPSRTAVNLEGDAAVSNRGGGIVKFAAEDVRCVDRNGNGTIDTSTGANDVRPFGEDECMLWHVPTPVDGNNDRGPRPTAWDAGTMKNACDVAHHRLWVGWWDHANNIGHFERLSGQDGSTLDVVDVLDWDAFGSTTFGPYGGAIDPEGDFWASGRSPGPLVRIDGETLVYDRWDVPEGESPYGIAVDADGHIWMADWNGGLLRFDPTSETFDIIDTPNSARGRGIMIDREGFAWVAGNNPCGAIQVDTTTLAVVNDTIELPGCDRPVGVSIDVDGYVWLPDRDADVAYKLDPHTYATTKVTGLVGPYTYSDMTGAGLGLVVNPPTG